MADFAGYPALASSHTWDTITTNLSGAIEAPAAAPSYTIYDKSFAAMANGTGTMSLVTSAVTGWYKAQHSVLAADGYAQGQAYFVKMDYTIGSTSYIHTQTFKVA